MAAPNPLQWFGAYAHPLGQEIVLSWTLPTTLPSSFKVVIFKKSGSDVTQQEIDDYFGDSPPSGVTVTELDGLSDGSGPLQLADFVVTNGTTYYYKVVIQNSSTQEYSTALGDNATPDSAVTTDVIDAKEKVIEVIERIMKNYNMTRNKDYELKKEYSLEKLNPPTIFVTRASGQVIQRFIGNLIDFDSANNEPTEGELELDNIQVTWEDPGADRRDKITNIFRESKIAMREFLLHENGGKMNSVDIIIEGDAINTAVEDRIQVSGMMLIACGIETKAKFVNDVASWAEAVPTFQE